MIRVTFDLQNIKGQAIWGAEKCAPIITHQQYNKRFIYNQLCISTSAPHLCCLADPDFDEPTLIEGDIAVKSVADRNADPCTATGCLWQKWSDGKVYIPYYIANHYCEHCFYLDLA